MRFNKHDKVEVTALGSKGTVITVRVDDLGVPLYTVWMEDPNATASGFYIAREWELGNRVIRR